MSQGVRFQQVIAQLRVLGIEVDQYPGYVWHRFLDRTQTTCWELLSWARRAQHEYQQLEERLQR